MTESDSNFSHIQYKEYLEILSREMDTSVQVAEHLCEDVKDIFINVFSKMYNTVQIDHMEMDICGTGTCTDTCTCTSDKMYILGLYFCYIKKDHVNAKKCWLISVEKGNIKASHCLGRYYHKIEPLYEQMKMYFLMAIEKNHLLSMYNLGYYYFNEGMYGMALHYWFMIIETKRKHSLIFQHTNTNVNTNRLEGMAMNMLGIYYAQIEKNYEKAEHYYGMAIEKDYVKAMNNLGCHHIHVTKNYEKAEYYLTMGFEKNNIDAGYLLGVYHYRTTKDYLKAKYYWEIIIEKGHVDALNNLGLYYYEVIKDNTKAKYYWDMAFEKGSSMVLNNLGTYYWFIEQNYEKAVNYWSMSLEKGYFYLLESYVFRITRRAQAQDVYEKLCVLLKHIVSHNDSKTYLESISKFFKDTFILWKTLNKLNQNVDDGTIVYKPNEGTVQFMDSLISPRIITFKECLKKAELENVRDICPLCLEHNTLIIKTNCVHGVCSNCCDPQNKCFFKWCTGICK